MNCIIPFEGKVKFDYQVKEINSISLEHEYTINDGSILGNFLISGTVKEHELSVNTTDFNFTLPFDVMLPENIDFNTIEFMIDNFVYELDDNYLNVAIDYIVKANDIESRNVTENIEEDIKVDEEIVINDDILDKDNIITIEENDEEDNNRIINNLSFEDDYECMKIHIVKENETIEDICKKYNIDKDYFLSINQITSIEVNDKLIIPDYEE